LFFIKINPASVVDTPPVDECLYRSFHAKGAKELQFTDAE
jgi:hypothetical protein